MMTLAHAYYPSFRPLGSQHSTGGTAVKESKGEYHAAGSRRPVYPPALFLEGKNNMEVMEASSDDLPTPAADSVPEAAESAAVDAGSVTQVKVAVRLRPLIGIERGAGCQPCMFGDSDNNQVRSVLWMSEIRGQSALRYFSCGNHNISVEDGGACQTL